jgi:parallel beta-helix repeat protein
MKRFVTFVLLLAVAGCDTPGRIAAPPELSADRLGRADIVVHPGESIQAAVDAAGPGTVIQIEPGTYAEAIHISVPGLALVGQQRPDGRGVVIENPGGEEHGIRVDAASDRFVLLNVTVRGFGENGVLLQGVDGFLLSGVTAQNNGEYGLFPVHSSNGLIERCRASGHNDTGIYVGQSHDVTVRHSVAFANVNGIEFENSQRVQGVANETYDNVVGILVVVLPGLDVKTTRDVLVARNRVHDNNHPNFAPPGDLASFVPSGSGILIVGADRATVEGNTVSGNQFTGIAVGSTLLLGALAGLPPEAFADIEPNPDHAVIRNNRVIGNGTASPIPFLPAVDLLWDGAGVGNCWSRNRHITSVPDPLPACAR